jgi:hypothetical protein
LLNSPDLGAKFAAILRFDDQSIALQLGRARWPHQKCNVGSALEEHSAEISSERARAQYQVSHLPLRCRRLASPSKHTGLLSG